MQALIMYAGYKVLLQISSKVLYSMMHYQDIVLLELFFPVGVPVAAVGLTLCCVLLTFY